MICGKCHEEIFYGPRGCFCTRQAAKEFAERELKKNLAELQRILDNGELEELKTAMKDIIERSK